MDGTCLGFQGGKELENLLMSNNFSSLEQTSELAVLSLESDS